MTHSKLNINIFKRAQLGIVSIEQEFLSIKEVAVIFGVNECTIRRAINRGWIVAFKIGEGSRSPYRISRRTIDNMHLGMILKHKENKERARCEEV